MKPNSKGVLMFAHNNKELDYIRMAIVNALLVQKNMGLTRDQITIVTDTHSLAYAEDTLSVLVHQACGNYIVVDVDTEFKHKNQRQFKDTSITIKKLPFYNVNRSDAYELSPYDETILIDVDYLILSNSLNQCWGHANELMMSYDYKDVMFERVHEELARIGDLGITMYWATVVYFRKTEYCETFFNFVKHVRGNREYYGNLYNWRGGLYRNDYSFSVAAHMISGFKDKGVPQLPVQLYKTFDTDDIYEVMGLNDIVLYLEKVRSPGDFILTRWKDVDIHVMNKWALTRISESMLVLLDG